MSEALARFKDKKPAKVEWSPPQVVDCRWDMIIAFDPSLSATGMVVLQRRGELIHVMESRTLRTPRPTEGKEGPTEWLLRAMALRKLMRDALYPYSVNIPHSGVAVVHEAPPTGANRLERTESALMASTVLRTVLEDLNMIMAPMVAIPEHKRVTGGDAKAKKIDHHRVLRAYAPDIALGWSAVTNADERDAFSVGLTELLRKDY